MSGWLAGHSWWVLLLAFLGALAVVTVIVTLFFSLGRRPQRMSVTLAPEVGSPEFLAGIAGVINAPLQTGGTARLLNNGVEIFPAILEALEGAERSINFMVYIWEAGRASDRLLEVLGRRAREGVEVRLLLDAIGGISGPDDAFDALRDAGARVEWFRPLSLGKLTRYHKRNHRRAIVADGRIGFTGGAAVGDKWLGDAGSPDHWRDVMVEVRGTLAVDLQSAFAQLWASSTGEILLGNAFYPDGGKQGEVPGERLSRHVNVISSPADDAHPLRKLFWTTIRCARERLYIVSPYFVPDDDTRKVIAHRAEHGVDVRILLPNHLTDARPIRQASHSYYQPLLDAGVRIYEYQPTFLHSKLMVADGRWSIVGSANMDIRSKELNQENVIGILDEEFAAEIEKSFLRDLREAREIVPEEWRRRGIAARVAERFCVLFAEQF